MPRTLYGKLVAALFVLVTLISLIYVALTVTTTRLYLQEVNQKLNQKLAANIVAETPLLQGRRINRAAFEELFHSLMVINPSIELYLIDPEGEILLYNAPAGRVKRDRISLAPVRAFLSGAEAFPIRGDDPRDPQGRKVFSVAKLREGDRLAGYLYVVLGSEAFDSAAEMIQDSYSLRLAVGVGLASLALALIAGLVSFNWLTRRLRRLSAAVEAFREGEFQAAMTLSSWRRGPGSDEIDELGMTVANMSQCIVDQIRQLHHSDAARREMIANISHDLRTPLTSLQGYLETLLIKENTLTEAERHHYLDLATKHGKRLSQLIAELFELALLESQDADRRFEPFSLTELAQDVAQKFELEAKKHGLTLETEIPAGAPFVFGDIALIERVLENLIENAIKYTPAGGRIRLSLVPGSGRIAARISDTGVGIPEHAIPHIFERLYRAEKSRGEGPEGTGLGLAIARRILDLHGSSITVESKLGDGTSFSFDLPTAA